MKQKMRFSKKFMAIEIVSVLLGISILPQVNSLIIGKTQTKNMVNQTTQVVNDKNHKKYAVILCGTAINRFFDPFKLAFIKTTNHAYQALKHVGYKDKDIFYLSKHFGISVDGLLTKIAFKYAITGWLQSCSNADTDCFIFMVDHGCDGGYFGLTKWNLLRDYELAEWFKDLEYHTLTILIDSCYSGDFIQNLSAQGRIIMTSTNTTSTSWANLADESEFSKTFFNEMEKTSDTYKPSYGELWEAADKCYFSNRMNPQIDDNGDGFGTGTPEYDALPLNGDGDLALNIYP